MLLLRDEHELPKSFQIQKKPSQLFMNAQRNFAWERSMRGQSTTAVKSDINWSTLFLRGQDLYFWNLDCTFYDAWLSFNIIFQLWIFKCCNNHVFSWEHLNYRITNLWLFCWSQSCPSSVQFPELYFQRCISFTPRFQLPDFWKFNISDACNEQLVWSGIRNPNQCWWRFGSTVTLMMLPVIFVSRFTGKDGCSQIWNSTLPLSILSQIWNPTQFPAAKEFNEKLIEARRRAQWGWISINSWSGLRAKTPPRTSTTYPVSSILLQALMAVKHRTPAW